MRNDQLIRQHRMIWLLMDGRSRKAADFEPIRRSSGVTVKTLHRDLEALERVPELQIVRYNRLGQLWWRMDAKPPDAVDSQFKPDKKVCGKCGVSKILDDFHKDRGELDGHRGVCKQCVLEVVKDWVKRNRKQYNRYKRNWHRKHRNSVNERRRANYKSVFKG